MGEEKLLTIIIPAYNMEKYLVKCCNSLILNEKFDFLEILIINDGSTDSTSEIAHSFQIKYGNVFKVIDKENGNYGSCINRGLTEAKGYFIRTLDADDVYNIHEFECFVNYLATIKDEADKGDIVDLIITDSIEEGGEGNPERRREFSFSPEKHNKLERTQLKDFEKVTHHCVTYRTEMLRKMNYKQTEEISYTDQEWVTIPLLAVNTFVYYPKPVYLYTKCREGQTMETKTFIKNTWMQILIKKDMLAFNSEKGFSFPVENRELFRELLCLSIEKIYARFLLLNREELNEKDLIEFDSFLKEKYKEYYLELNSMVYSKEFPFRYISYWRNKKDKWKYNLVYKIFCVFSKIKHYLQKRAVEM